MFEAYKVGIRLSLVSNVATGLAGMSRHFIQAGAHAKALQMELNRLKALAMTGGIVTGVGLFGLHLMDKMLGPAEEYTHQLNVMNMAGFTHMEQVKAIGDAWQNTGKVITTTATDNLRSLLDLRNILGNLGEAQAALPIISRIQAVMGASTSEAVSGNAKNFTFDIAKAADIAGYAKNPEEFQKFAENMARVIMATQGRVTPNAYLSVLKYARQARYSLNDDFLFHYLPTLILENAGASGGGGGSRGVGPMIAAMFRVTNQGYISRQALPLLQSLGLVRGNPLGTTTTGTTVESFKMPGLAGANPFEWAQKVLMPAMHRKYGEHLTRQQIAYVVGQLFRGNQLAASAMTEFLVKPFNFERDKRLIEKTPTIAEAYKHAISNDPNTAAKALSAQWENLKISFMMGVVPVLIPLLVKLSHAFELLGKVMRDHPQITKAVALGLATLFATMGLVIGPLLVLRASFGLLRLAVPGLTGSLTQATSALGMLGKASALLAAGYLGYEAGTWINDHLLTPLIQSLTGKKGATLGTEIYDLTHEKTAHSYGYYSGETSGTPVHGPSAVGPNGSGKAVVHHTHVYLDGKQIARVVTKHQAKGMGGPSTGAQGLRPADAYYPADAASLAIP